MSDTELAGEMAWPWLVRARLVAAVIVTIVVAVGPTAYVAARAIGETRAAAEDARLRLAQFAAQQADRVLAEAFHEVAAAADACASTRFNEATTCTARTPAFNRAMLVFGPDGSLMSAEPPWSTAVVEGANATAALEDLLVADGRAVSGPFAVATIRHVVAGLGVPVYGASGSRVGTVVGLLDLTDPMVADLVVPALRLGFSGHADLVDERGLVLASTNPNHVLELGDHPGFYARVTTGRVPVVDEVPHDADVDDADQSRSHVMAYAPLRHAPWGMAIGASAHETYGTIASLRSQLITAALAEVGALAVGITGVVWWISGPRSGRPPDPSRWRPSSPIARTYSRGASAPTGR